MGGRKGSDDRELEEASLRGQGIELEEGSNSGSLLCLLLVSFGLPTEPLLLLLIGLVVPFGSTPVVLLCDIFLVTLHAVKRGPRGERTCRRWPVKKSESLDEFEYDLGLRTRLNQVATMHSPQGPLEPL